MVKSVYPPNNFVAGGIANILSRPPKYFVERNSQLISKLINSISIPYFNLILHFKTKSKDILFFYCPLLQWIWYRYEITSPCINCTSANIRIKSLSYRGTALSGLDGLVPSLVSDLPGTPISVADSVVSGMADVTDAPVSLCFSGLGL